MLEVKSKREILNCVLATEAKYIDSELQFPTRWFPGRLPAFAFLPRVEALIFKLPILVFS